jgi:hypothetical protein
MKHKITVTVFALLLCMGAVCVCARQRPRKANLVEPEKDRIADFLAKEFLEGISSQSLTVLKGSSAALAKVLDDQLLEARHKNIMVALGWMGDAYSRFAIIKYIENTKGSISLDRFEALLNAPLALGHLSARGDEEALAYLLGHARPEAWDKLGWTFGEKGRSLGVFMSRAVLNGLGVSGRKEVLATLEGLRNVRYLSECAEDSIKLLNKGVVRDRVDSSEAPAPLCGDGASQVSAFKGSAAKLALLERSLVVQPLSVAHHAAVGITDHEVMKALENASSLLQGSSDFKCPLKFDMLSFQSFGAVDDRDDVIQCESQLIRVLCRSGSRVKIVISIAGNNLCETVGVGTFAGCAEIGGMNMLLKYTLHGDIWAHEFGHNQRLPHRFDNMRLIMNPNAQGSHEVNERECQGFLAGGQGPL